MNATTHAYSFNRSSDKIMALCKAWELQVNAAQVADLVLDFVKQFLDLRHVVAIAQQLLHVQDSSAGKRQQTIVHVVAGVVKVGFHLATLALEIVGHLNAHLIVHVQVT